MSIFAFDSAVTTLGNFGAGRTAVFDVVDIVPCTLDEVCEKLDLIATALSARGFRRERPSRMELFQQGEALLVEMIDIHKQIQRINKHVGISEGDNYGRNR